ncbi:uncharacterized protein LOC131224998 [Magnolia sinica]|uniref:uncharacterized protein LOC131224998 n=1 Tax=Magnolia sinica TaxID=86752 RepID=UPI0026580175|nr:uncharacterized protein LOC131224998 [Magnolia sinica]
MDSSDEESADSTIVFQAVAAYVQVVGEYCHTYMFKQPARHGDDERARFINSIIRASDKDCVDQLRMNRESFFELCALLREKTRLRDTRNAIISMYPDLVKPAIIEPSSEIQTNPNWSAYFKDCVGAIDGTHIPAHVLAVDHASFSNRKGVLSQNVLAACTFDMKFTYVLAGWEGSASDARVLHNALTRSDDPLLVSNGKYYVVDAGYAHSPGFMAPYWGVRYHLQEYQTGRAPANMKELFNYQYAQLRNAIERCFSLLKGRFSILKSAMQYEFQTQVEIVIACCVLHNYIHVQNESPQDSDFATISGVDVEGIPTPQELSRNYERQWLLRVTQREKDAWN